MKQPVLLRIYRNGELETVKQFDTDQIVIGQNEDLQVHLADSAISPIHAVIEERDTGYYVSDLGSQAGTFRNGNKIFDEKLESGDEVEVGPYKIEFFIGIPKPTQPPKSGGTIHDDLDDVKTVIRPPSLESRETEEGPPPPAEEVKAEEVEEKSAEEATTEKVAIISATEVTDKVEAKADEPPIPSEPPPVADKPALKIGGAPLEKEDPSLGTYAPPSDLKDLNDIMKPGKGPVVEVIVAWGERIVSSHHFLEEKSVTIGHHKNCNVILPLIGTNAATHQLLTLNGLATVHITPEMSGDFTAGNATTSLADLKRKSRMTKTDTGFSVELQQDEMLRLGLHGGLISIYIRYSSEAPKPVVAPLLDLTATEVISVMSAVVVAAIFGLYMLIYSPEPIEDPELLEEKIRKAVVTFRPPKQKIKQVTDSTQKVKTIVKVKEKKKQSPKTQKKTKPGKAAAVKPSKNKTKRKNFGAARSGGAKKTGKKAGASAKSKKPDLTSAGLLSAFGGKGVKNKLDKTFDGSGELLGDANRATGFTGMNRDRAGNNIGNKLKATGSGKGSATIGAPDVGTGGKGRGAFGPGTGGIGSRSRVELNIAGQEAEVPGFIDREAIRRVIVANKRAIKACYEKELNRDRDLYGKIVLEWDIEEGGRVTSARVKSDSLGSKRVGRCISRLIKTLTFPEPPPDQIARVAFPFVFASQ